jgi:hypothetical protein
VLQALNKQKTMSWLLPQAIDHTLGSSRDQK